MTAHRNQQGDWVLKTSIGTAIFRWALIIAFVSQTPMLDPLWKQVGMKSLSTQIDDVNAEVKVVQNKINELYTKVAELERRRVIWDQRP